MEKFRAQQMKFSATLQKEEADEDGGVEDMEEEIEEVLRLPWWAFSDVICRNTYAACVVTPQWRLWKNLLGVSRMLNVPTQQSWPTSRAPSPCLESRSSQVM